MLTTLAIAAFLAAPPAAKSDPFVARPVPAAKADPYAATELPQEHAGPLTAGDFLDERETKDLRDLAHALQIEQAADGIVVRMPAGSRDKLDTIVKLELERPGRAT